MTKGSTKMLGTSVKPDLLREVDAIRGEIPRSRIVERALSRFLKDVESGKINLLPNSAVAKTAALGVKGGMRQKE